MLTDWLDASVIDEFDPTSRDPSLDPFDPGPPYDAEFVTRYRAAQRDRNARITAWCHAELDRLEAVGIGDRLFTMTRTWADLRMMDPALDPSDRRTPWCYGGDPRKANAGVFGIGTRVDVPQLAEHVEPHRLRLPRPARTSPACTCRRSSCRRPGDAGVFPSQAQEIFDAIASTDKQLEHVAGRPLLPGARPAPATTSPTSSPPGSTEH